MSANVAMQFGRITQHAGAKRSSDDGGIIVPSAYQRVEFVGLGNGHVEYNLNLAPTNHFVFADIVVVTYGGNSVIFGTASGSRYFHMTEYNNRMYWGRNGTEANSSTNNTVSVGNGSRYIIKYNYGDNYEVIINDISCSSGTEITVTNDNVLKLGKRDGTYYGLKINFYTFQVTDKSTGKMVRNLIPVYRKSDNAIGFWDAVNDVFYENVDTGTPIAGDDIN